jgi:EmrB/QacA subfamily drug resistance transporter
LITLGGLVLLAGRMSDLFGRRRLFLVGIAVFTVASLCCGIATTQLFLLFGRAFQGIGAALILANVFAISVHLFESPGERAKALGVLGMMFAVGGSAGVFLGGAITSILSWNWIFFINIPIGVVIFVLARKLLPADVPAQRKTQVDFLGAFTVTVALMLAVYALINVNSVGWISLQTLGLLSVACGLIGLFVVIESRIRWPLFPLTLFGHRNLAAGTGVRLIFNGVAIFGVIFLSSLYFQQVLRYTPLEIGLALLVLTATIGIVSYKFSARLITRFGVKPPIAVGLFAFMVGVLLLAHAPPNAQFLVDILPALVVIGVGQGIGAPPLILAGMSDLGERESGFASGMLNTAAIVGGALGLSVLASVSASQAESLRASGESLAASLDGGYDIAYVVIAFLLLVGIVITTFLIHPIEKEPDHEVAEPAGSELEIP